MKPLEDVIEEYRGNRESVYNTWFTNNEERLKAFRSIRRGVLQVVEDIKAGTFPNDFKGSSLEFVLTCITEQKQVFEGAAHPFYWKPKLRIPDIYETQANKNAFGQFLNACLNAQREETILKEIHALDGRDIKGLGPAVANILYFLHPTMLPPFNTAIVKGFNSLFRAKKKLGSWTDYLEMREVIIETNGKQKALLSNDLGAFVGLLFEIGIGNILTGEEAAMTEDERRKIERQIEKRRVDITHEQQEDDTHKEMQYHLLKIGRALGYDSIAAANDRSRKYKENDFRMMSLNELPSLQTDSDTFGTINLIDVLWLEKGSDRIVSAFEIEKTTSIYSGILRLSDLSFSLPENRRTLFLVIPDGREKDDRLQLTRPAFRENRQSISYILFSDLREHCDALCRFGDDHGVMRKISRTVE